MAQNRIKLAVSTYSLLNWRRENGKTLEQSLDWIAGSGVDGIEISLMSGEQAKDPRKQAASLRRRCDKLGMPVVSYCTGAELLVAPEAQHEAVAPLKNEVQFAAALGAPSMRHDVTRGPRPKDQTAKLTLAGVLRVVAPAVHEVCDFAQELGVKTSVENHGFYLQTADRVEKLVKAVAHPNYGVTLDMGNFLCLNQDPVDAVARLARYAFMVHAKDFHVKPIAQMPPSGWFATPSKIALRGAIVGHGNIDVPAQLKALKAAKYKGYLSLEFEGMEEPTLGVRLGLEFLRRELDRIGA